MNYRQTLSRLSPAKGFQLGLQPALAWIAILGLVFFSAMCLLAGAGKILNLAFPAGAFAVSVLLYVRYPVLYIGFTWWMFFLTPLVRRLADYQSSYTEPSPILLAPFLVAAATLVTFWQNLPKTYSQGSLPFALSSVGVFYSFLVGLINQPPLTASLGLLNWLIPVTFGFHLFVKWRDYPSYRQNIQHTFVWGVLIMGVYGIVQYLMPPEWDRFWLINAPVASQGAPEPFELRVWSTMNSTEPFSAVMTAGLLLLFHCKGFLSLSASVAGYLAFLLSLARSAWIGWFVGLLTLATSLKVNTQIRLIITIVAMAVLVVPLTTVEPFSEVINSRIATFSNLEEDGSLEGRKEIYNEYLWTALTSFVGEGIGGEGYDSAILGLLLNLGWIGTLFYMGGMLLLVFRLFQSSKTNGDLFVGTARAIVISALVRLPANGPTMGVSGVVLWGFLALGLAAQKYHQHQPTAEPGQSWHE